VVAAGGDHAISLPWCVGGESGTGFGQLSPGSSILFEGNSSPTRIPITAITTNSSISVKPLRKRHMVCFSGNSGSF
jgi:hypothetical protein